MTNLTQTQQFAASAISKLGNLGFGVGLRSQHYPYIMSHLDQGASLGVDWFEIISENYIDNHGYGRYVLDKLKEQYPLVMHGVSMNIGSSDPLNFEYLSKLKTLGEFVKPQLISDHLCWTGLAGLNSHDLLPMPLTDESLQHVIRRIDQVQDFLERPLVLENPSTYLEFQHSTLTESEFFCELVKATGCGMLLDVNNVFVSSFNHGFNAEQFIHELPHEHIVQIHLAGPSDCGDCLIDTHDQPVPEKVWQLYQLAQSLTGGASTLLEWDANIPSFPELVEELNKAKLVLTGHIPQQDTVSKTNAISTPIVNERAELL